MNASYSIIHASLDDVPEYETVSYVWGDASASHTISLVDGSILYVTSSVARALPYLVKSCRAEYLWMDQLTINQSDLVERSQQVRIMGEIYLRCSRCMIWMDTEYTITDDGGTLFAQWDKGLAGQYIIDFSSSVNDDMSRQDSRSITEHLEWFLSHPWFSRAWVYQESVLPSETCFLLGDFEIPGEAVNQLVGSGWWIPSDSWLENLKRRLHIDQFKAASFQASTGMKFLLAAEKSRDRRKQDANHETISPWKDHFNAYESITYAAILKEMGGSQAHDARDHVYAFVGLAPFLLDHLQVDYSLSIEETFAAMMRALVSESKSLDFFAHLTFEWHMKNSKLQLPSWVPDWSNGSDLKSVEMLCHDNLFNACGTGFGLPSISKCKHTVSLTAVWNQLDVAGKIIDVVEYVTTPFSDYQWQESVRINYRGQKGGLPWEMKTLRNFMSELNKRGLESGEYIDISSLLRTLLMDGVRWAALDSLESAASLYRTGQQIVHLPHWEKTADLVAILTDDSEKPDFDSLPYNATLETLHELSKVQWLRRVAYCSAKRFALLPNLTEMGDKIAILHGSRTPVVLRGLENGKYQVIGQCFYDGAMYGEMADLDDDAADTFTLV